MKLQIDGEPKERVDDVATLRIRCASISAEGPRFAILVDPKSGWFAQAYANEGGMFDFEIQRGSIDEHYEVQNQVDRRSMLRLFEAFHQSGDLPSDTALVKKIL